MKTRRKALPEILAVLADGQWRTAKDIQATTGLSASTINSHLNDLAGRPWRELPTGSVRPVEREMRSVQNLGCRDARGRRLPQQFLHYRLRSGDAE